jgi:RecB family endonuclease NucS
MRLIVARCEVRYSGRLEALLPEAVRLLVFKGYGSVLVHSDSGGYKPQNWRFIKKPTWAARSSTATFAARGPAIELSGSARRSSGSERSGAR